MNLKSILLLAIISLIGLTAKSQEEINIRPDKSKKLGTSYSSQTYSAMCDGSINSPSSDIKWKPVLKRKINGIKHKAPGYDLIEKIKSEKLKVQNQQVLNDRNSQNEKSISTVVPIVGIDWIGNASTGFSPLDNSIAISNNGIIVSVANTSMEIYDTTGNVLYSKDLVSFINDPSITDVCDPLVLYDPIADRFIFFCQVSPVLASTSRLLIFFSKTNNPVTGDWYYYNSSGNPLNDSTGFDYPKMAINNNELYITGNMFYDNGNFKQALIWQINKRRCYLGDTMKYTIWKNIVGNPFTLLPLSRGQQGNYGQGCFLISTNPAGDSTINLYDLTDSIGGSPELYFFSIPITPYSVPANAKQPGTTNLLDVGDCRLLSGFFQNGIVHFVFGSDQGNTYSGINYNRLNLSTDEIISSIYGVPGVSYAYPAVASYANSPIDKSVMIGFAGSGQNVFPVVRAINCDDNMNWSISAWVKSTTNYVCYSSGCPPIERWGDYSGIARKHNSPKPSVWLSGAYASSTTANTWLTRIAEIHDESIVNLDEIKIVENTKVFPNPVEEFCYIEFSLIENTKINISIYDISGKLIKELYNGRGFQGENVFSFNKANLKTGTYFVSIICNSKTIKNEKIIIAD